MQGRPESQPGKAAVMEKGSECQSYCNQSSDWNIDFKSPQLMLRQFLSLTLEADQNAFHLAMWGLGFQKVITQAGKLDIKSRSVCILHRWVGAKKCGYGGQIGKWANRYQEDKPGPKSDRLGILVEKKVFYLSFQEGTVCRGLNLGLQESQASSLPWDTSSAPS